jgi:thiamine pyrophosphokinase
VEYLLGINQVCVKEPRVASRAVVFVNGEVDDAAALRNLLRPHDRLVAADGGVRHLRALGLWPHVLVGDLDSVEPGVLAAARTAGVAIEEHPRAKAQTDLELAIERAIRDGAEEVLLVGALGGRLDQTLANLLILAQRPWAADIRIAEAGQVASLVRAGQTLRLQGAAGSTVSAIPFSPVVTGITYRGLEYPLENATLHFGATTGISNVIAQPPASVTIASGILLVVQEALPA